jgi:hypothetical protein
LRSTDKGITDWHKIFQLSRIIFYIAIPFEKVNCSKLGFACRKESIASAKCLRCAESEASRHRRVAGSRKLNRYNKAERNFVADGERDGQAYNLEFEIT